MMNAQLELRKLKEKLNAGGHITAEDVEKAQAAVRLLYSNENMTLYGLLKREFENQPEPEVPAEEAPNAEDAV